MDWLLNSLYSPFFYFFFGTLAGWAYLVIRYYRRSSRCHRAALALYGLGLLLVGGLAAPLGNRLLLRTLLVPGAAIDPEDPALAPPDYILVAASGYLIMEDPREDVLSDNTAARVATAASLHARFPDAFVVMQGTGFREGGPDAPRRPSERQGRLMAQLAESLGVPREKILLEDQSRNTREHVAELAKLPGVDAGSRLIVVSSDWHIRRIRMVFSPKFPNTLYYGSRTPCAKGFALRELLPAEGTLAQSRLYLREWTAILYYGLKG